MVLIRCRIEFDFLSVILITIIISCKTFHPSPAAPYLFQVGISRFPYIDFMQYMKEQQLPSSMFTMCRLTYSYYSRSGSDCGRRR